MRQFIAVGLVGVFCSAGCNNSPADAPKNPPASQPALGGALAPATDKGKLTQSYWDRCIEVNKQFVTDKGEVWLKEFRPTVVGETCREAAKQLRAIDNAGVDPEVIDHVNRVIRGFEQMGAIAETKGKESMWQDATSAVAFVIKIAKAGKGSGAVADGGSLAMGIGASEQGGKTTRDGQLQTIGIATKLMDSEEQVIRNVRKTYGIELRPW